ncbi:hypothetical protein HG530_003084 [Fusarium avenaceum]|nr:hypothetical protein HG530_003084 [Fusarium avenaceum]
MHRKRIRTPIAGLEFGLCVNPGVVDSSFWVSLGNAKGLRGLVLAVTLTTFDADMLRFEVVFVVEAEPAILVPDRYALVHTVVPGLKTLNGTFGGPSEPGGKFLLDT